MAASAVVVVVVVEPAKVVAVAAASAISWAGTLRAAHAMALARIGERA